MPTKRASDKGLIWANLLHLGYNMWADRNVPEYRTALRKRVIPSPVLRFDTTLWQDVLREMAAAGMNMVVLDLGEGVRYESHPELAAKKAWSVSRLKREIARMRAMGLEPIPKLNFSTAHDTWLGPYSRCVSTPAYYSVCSDLIAEVSAIFDKPRFFHLGYDEETAGHQGRYAYVLIRQYELWWHDFYFFVKEVEKHGVRPWIWSDYVWNHRDEFYAKMPKSVLQSNWYYGASFHGNRKYVRPYRDLESHGYDQVPAGSNNNPAENFGRLVTYCRKHVSASRLFGFMQTVWRPTLERFRPEHMQAIRLVGKAISGS